MKMKQLVYKSKFGDIPVLVRDYVPRGEVWFFNGDAPIDIFNENIVAANIQTGLIKKVKFITKFNKKQKPAHVQNKAGF